jgi:hypothetical protein
VAGGCSVSQIILYLVIQDEVNKRQTAQTKDLVLNVEFRQQTGHGKPVRDSSVFHGRIF